jgi:hypothetical protein
MLGLVVAACIVTMLFAERIGVNRGFGWDGRAYAHWAQDLPGAFAHHEIDSFQAQRVLPSAIVYVATGGHASDRGVILGFQILDAVMLVLACACFTRIARMLAWQRLAAWAGFASLFGCFAIARHALYDPVLTDPTAFALGSLSLLGFVERRTWVIAVAAALAMVTWPPLLLVNAAALCLPRPVVTATEPSHGRGLAIVGAVIGGALVIAWFAYVLAGADDVAGMAELFARTIRTLWPVTIASLVIYAAAALWFLGRAWDLQAIREELRIRSVAIGALVIVVLVVATTVWARTGTEPGGFTFLALLFYDAGTALHAPLWSLVHHVVYFGPLVVVIVLRWPQIACASRTWGLAAPIIWTGVIFMAVSSETRHLIAALPWIVVFTIDATRELWTHRRLAIFTALTIAWSKVWFVIGYTAHHDSYRFPDQRYMMHLGPWATNGPFIVHAIAAVLSAILLY